MYRCIHTYINTYNITSHISIINQGKERRRKNQVNPPLNTSLAQLNQPTPKKKKTLSFISSLNLPLVFPK